MGPDEGRLGPGVRELDHTADLGMEVHGATLAELFDRAARGTFGLILAPEVASDASGGRASPAAGSRTRGADDREIAVRASGPAELLVRWLRELLYAHEMESVAYDGARFDELTGTTARARVRMAPAARAIREIKGVTYHDLEVGRDEDGWHARIIFDV